MRRMGTTVGTWLVLVVALGTWLLSAAATGCSRSCEEECEDQYDDCLAHAPPGTSQADCGVLYKECLDRCAGSDDPATVEPR